MYRKIPSLMLTIRKTTKPPGPPPHPTPYRYVSSFFPFETR